MLGVYRTGLVQALVEARGCAGSRLFRPEYVRFYRDALAGRHPHLVQEQHIAVENFMPELLLHRQLYGTFQLFVGDLRIFRVVD